MLMPVVKLYERWDAITERSLRTGSEYDRYGIRTRQKDRAETWVGSVAEVYSTVSTWYCTSHGTAHQYTPHTDAPAKCHVVERMQLQGKREEAPQGCHPWRSAGVGRATGEEPTPGSMIGL